MTLPGVPADYVSGDGPPATEINAIKRHAAFGSGTRIIARHERTTASTTTTTTTGVGVIQLTGIPLYAGRSYRIYTNTLVTLSSVATDSVGVRLRYTTTGTTPTTASAVLPGTYSDSGGRNNFTQQIDVHYDPATDETLGLLLNMFRASGTGNAQLWADANYRMNLYVADNGLAVPATGVNV